MQDVITYSDDTQALLDEVADKFPEYLITDEDTGERSIVPLTKTPTKRSGDETLVVCRHFPEELSNLDHLKVIGYVSVTAPHQYEPAFTVEGGEEIYERIYPTAPVTYVDEDGIEQTYTPPKMFGVIAGCR